MYSLVYSHQPLCLLFIRALLMIIFIAISDTYTRQRFVSFGELRSRRASFLFFIGELISHDHCYFNNNKKRRSSQTFIHKLTNTGSVCQRSVLLEAHQSLLHYVQNDDYKDFNKLMDRQLSFIKKRHNDFFFFIQPTGFSQSC